MRATLYTQNTGTENECGVAVEVIWNPDELRAALKDGEITVEQVTETLKRGVSAVGNILKEFGDGSGNGRRSRRLNGQGVREADEAAGDGGNNV